jgi:hypothetical protein
MHSFCKRIGAKPVLASASITAVVALSGCAVPFASHDDPPTRAEYVKRIDAVCSRFDARGDAAERDLRAAAGGASAGDVSSIFPRISPPLARLVEVTDEAVREMRAVPRPTGDAGADAKAWIDVLGDQTRTTHKLQNIVRQRDQAAFLRLAQEDVPALSERTRARARVLGLKRCSSRDTTSRGSTAPMTPAPSPSPSPLPAPGGQDESQVARAGLDEPLRVKSTEGDVVMRVVRVRPRVKPNRFSPPGAGEKLVGVDLAIRNVGSKTFSPPLVATARILDSRGRLGTYATLIDGPCGRGFALNPTVTPGTSEEGCMPFAIDEGASPARLQVRFGFGTGQVIAEFDLSQRGRLSTAAAPSISRS